MTEHDSMRPHAGKRLRGFGPSVGGTGDVPHLKCMDQGHREHVIRDMVDTIIGMTSQQQEVVMPWQEVSTVALRTEFVLL
ncbi:MAG: hypothetical protein Q7T26_08995, partial [Dehalococcoidia bacterium]|nr:hypothetical protein [Dehalococcoidia bacterium]